MVQATYTQGLPTWGVSIADAKGNLAPIWYQFFLTLWERTGGATGSVSLQLDSVSNQEGAVLYRGPAAWQGLSPGAQYKILQMGTVLPQWGDLPTQSFGTQVTGSFLAAPAIGNGVPTFRNIVSTDLNSTAGQYPGTATNDDAAAGYLGEYLSSVIASGAAVSLVSGTSKDITTLTLSSGDWDVWGNVATAPAGTTTQSDIRAWINTVSATDPGPPNNGNYAEIQMAIAAGLRQVLSLSPMRVKVPASSTQIVYLSANVTFAISTLAAYGALIARRAR